MRLVSCDIRGFGRFRGGKLNVDARVVALVGPNESGKSSLLRALQWINDINAPIPPSQLSRFAPADPDMPVIEALFRIEPADLVGVSDFVLEDVQPPNWLCVRKFADGHHTANVYPEVKRSKFLRYEVDPKLDNFVRARGEREEWPALSDLKLALWESTDEGKVREIERSKIEQAIKELDGRSEDTGKALLAALHRLEKYETHNPDEVVVGRLVAARPQILLFSEAERSLSSDYDLQTAADGPPVALANLARFAGIDLRQLRDLTSANRYAQRDSLLQAASDRVTRALGDAWKQDRIGFRFSMAIYVLRLYATNLGSDDPEFTDLTERSDGLRSFVALLAFIETRGLVKKPIVLIDEAEAHLHYDAQADLVRVFGSQTAAGQVIYTTHSAGCLPEDLGTGIRVCVKHGQESEISNAFWSHGPGLSPLLFAMGANVFAFTPARRAVIGEGAADLILGPSLFREAMDLESLPFQIAPGLAEVSSETARDLDMEAARVAYLVDGDKGGKKIKRHLERAGVETARIVMLLGDAAGVTPEDWLDPDIYRGAVSRELPAGHSYELADVGGFGRAAELAAWCTGRGIRAPNKAAVAQAALDIIRDSRSAPGARPLTLLEETKKDAVRAVYWKLATALGLRKTDGPIEPSH